MTDHTIGVDISKASSDVFDSKRQEVRRFDNTDAGFSDLLKWLVHTHRHALSMSLPDLITVISKTISQARGHL